MQFNRINREDKFIILMVAAVFVILVTVAWLLSTRWIIAISGSESMLQHIMIVDKNDKDVKKGDMVGFYYDGAKMHNYKAGSKFIKYMVCDEGDTLKVENGKYYCNNQYLAEAIKVNSYGEKVTTFVYNGTIPKGKFFAWTPFYYSYDSRYWGFADKDNIIGKGFGIFN